MKSNEYLKLQVGMFITDHQDITEPSNYCKILEFKDGQIRLQPYEFYNRPANAHPFWEHYRNINITEKLYQSEYYSLCRR